LKGEEAFNKYFTQVYGSRWPEIFEALFHKDEKVARRNLFASFPENPNQLGVGEAITEWPHCFKILENFDPSLWNQEVKPYYRMDPASLAPAKALDIKKGDQVLDMCAAPGGKTLVLLESLFNPEEDFDLSGKMVANELSVKRRHRMMSVFKGHLPKEIRQRIEITGVDGSKIGLFKKECFDRILLDAPCSGERGVVQKKSELAEWKEKRSKNFGIRQYSLLASAFSSLKPGGRIVYSTCSISPYENDQVIAKLLKRKGSEVEVLDSPEYQKSEETEYGRQYLPDQDGWGPIFFAVVEKQ
jgi:16S rRNA C967 or C1407 C5-methylase (RsmB/RsmF family)